MISPFRGVYFESSLFERNGRISCRPLPSMLRFVRINFLSTCATAVYKKPPAIPFSSAAMAAVTKILATKSAFNAANSVASFSQSAMASFNAVFASLRSVCACLSYFSSCAFYSSEASMLASTAGIFVLAAEILPSNHQRLPCSST